MRHEIKGKDEGCFLDPRWGAYAAAAGASTIGAAAAEAEIHYSGQSESVPAGRRVSAGEFDRTYSSLAGGNIRTFYGAGEFNGVSQGFVGFKFNTGAGTQYGWVRIKLTVSASRHGGRSGRVTALFPAASRASPESYLRKRLMLPRSMMAWR